MSETFAEGDKVTSALFDGTGEVEGVREEQGVTIVSVRLPEDSGVNTMAGVAAYDPDDLRHALAAYEPQPSGMEPQIKAADAAAVRCSVHPDSEPVERSHVDYRGVSVAVIHCSDCPDDDVLARYNVPVLH